MEAIGPERRARAGSPKAESLFGPYSDECLLTAPRVLTQPRPKWKSCMLASRIRSHGKSAGGQLRPMTSRLCATWLISRRTRERNVFRSGGLLACGNQSPGSIEWRPCRKRTARDRPESGVSSIIGNSATPRLTQRGDIAIERYFRPLCVGLRLSDPRASKYNLQCDRNVGRGPWSPFR